MVTSRAGPLGPLLLVVICRTQAGVYIGSYDNVRYPSDSGIVTALIGGSEADVTSVKPAW